MTASRPRRVGALALLLLAGACGPGPLVRRGGVNQELVARVSDRLVRTRGLAFLRPVPLRAFGPAEVAAAVDAELATALPPAERARIETVYVQLGLLPPEARLAPSLQRLFSTQLAAFYDPRRQQLAVATEVVELGAGARVLGTLSGRDLLGELVVAHELTHALQDQHWGLPAEMVPVTASHTDRVLARRALLEGDATWASFATVGGTLDDAMRARVLRQLDGLPAQLAASVPDVPPLLRETLAFQYRDGTAFVDRVLARGGWAAVDRAHADPPVSTEQVLHPERYLARKRDDPTSIEVASTTSLARAGFSLVMGDTLGEVVIGVLLRRSMPAERAAEIAAGWDGDRVAAFARGAELIVVWMTAWDSEADAAAFAAALGPPSPGTLVERRGTRVLAIMGPWPERLPAELWRTSRQTKAVSRLRHDGAVALELGQVGAHGEARGPDQAGVQADVDARHQGGDLRRSLAERLQDLPLPLQPMGEVLIEERLGLVHGRPVAGEDDRHVERPQAAQ